MKELLKEFIKSVIYEMRVINIGEQVPSDHYAIIAHKDKIFKFDDGVKLSTEEFGELFKQLDIRSNPSYIRDINYIGNYIDDRFDILYASVSDGILYINESLISPDPRLSTLVNKVLKQLNLKLASSSHSEYNNRESIEQNSKELKKDVQDIFWYHGTTTRHLDSILKLGLRPRKFTNVNSNFIIQHENVIFLTTKYSKAHFHADNAASIPVYFHSEGAASVLVKHKSMVIKVKKLPDPNLIAPDHDIDLFSGSKNLKSNTVKNSINSGVIGYLGSIPPRFIESFIINTSNDQASSYKEFTIDDLLLIKRENTIEDSNFSFSEYFSNNS